MPGDGDCGRYFLAIARCAAQRQSARLCCKGACGRPDHSTTSLDVPHGLDSPAGRVYELDGQVLLLGVDHTANTTIHLAESLAGVRYRRRKYALVAEGGELKRIEYQEIDHCCENFRLVDEWLERERLQRRGYVGHALARLARARDIVRVVMEQLERDETIFLHPFGVDEQCDEARASISSPMLI